MKKILIIEDDPVMLQELYKTFDELRLYEIKKATHGEEGLTLINVFHPDLVILDVMLPEIDGFQICQKIKEMPEIRRPNIVLLTALGPLLDRMESNWAHEVGVKGVFTKPLDFGKLHLLVEEIFR